MTDPNESAQSQPDWNKYSLQIATPSMDGKYERRYVKSFLNTCLLLKDIGVKFDWAEMPYNSEIAGARAKLFGNFLRSSHTHMLFIDADMGWEPQAVLRLLAADRDMIGAAGPKKIYAQTPCGLEFAVNNSDEHGNVQNILMEAGTGIIEVSEVGMAFMMISRACAERMYAAYQDLSFEANKNKETAVFDPMIVGDGRRLAEDFAFCYRWRKIGGKVLLLPDIRLDHVGSHTWSGALEQSFTHIQEMPHGA